MSIYIQTYIYVDIYRSYEANYEYIVGIFMQIYVCVYTHEAGARLRPAPVSARLAICVYVCMYVCIYIWCIYAYIYICI